MDSVDADDAVTEPVPVTGDDLVVWSEDGRFLITGDETAVDRFVGWLTPEREMRIGSTGTLADGLLGLAAATGVAGRVASRGRAFVEVSAEQVQKLKTQGLPDANGAYAPLLRGAAGRFSEQVRMTPVSPTNIVTANPSAMIAIAALRLAIHEVTESVEAVAADVAALKLRAETDEIGNLAGVYRVLANARSQVDEAGEIPQATWDAIAPHEVTVQQAADRQRAFLRETVKVLPRDGDLGERYDAVRRLLDEQTVSRSLRLLVLAEQSRLLWRSLKLDQVQRREPEALQAEANAAKAMMAANAEADRVLIAELRDAASALGKVGPLDGIRVMIRGKLPAAAAELRGQVDDFAGLRAQQIESWAPDPTPTFKDAARHVGALAGQVAGEGLQAAEKVAIEGRRAVGTFLVGLGSKLQSASHEKDEP